MSSPNSSRYATYTQERLAAALAKAQDDLDNGYWDSVSGAAKSGHLTKADTQQRIDDITATMRKRGLLPPLVNKVYSDFRTNHLDAF